jgi:dipeptidase
MLKELLKELLKDANLVSAEDHYILGNFFNTQQMNLAYYLYNRCYIVIRNKEVIGLFPEWEYDLEKVKKNFENEDYKNEIKIYSPLQKGKDTTISYINKLRDKEER